MTRLYKAGLLPAIVKKLGARNSAFVARPKDLQRDLKRLRRQGR